GGQYGDERVTVLNLKVVGVQPDRNILLVRGAVPGARNSLVFVRPAVKKGN
ncbi:MAG: 50S ribosomal protein L3, partial [Deltaproteobacteria bacterium]